MKVSDVAKRWVGKAWPPDNPNTARDESQEPAQCMNFVRAMLKEAGHPLAGRVTSAPVDEIGTSSGFANSLAGRDLGYLLTDQVDQLRPGSILFWVRTYFGDWPETAITHVGLYVGDGKFVHRPTMSRPVELATLEGSWRSLFRCALISPDQVGVAPAPSPTPAPAKPKSRPVKILSVEFVVETEDGQIMKLTSNKNGTTLVG